MVGFETGFLQNQIRRSKTVPAKLVPNYLVSTIIALSF